MFARLSLTLRSALQSLAHYRRRYAAVAAGAMLAAALLTGSLLTGASVRGSLEAQAARRTGTIEYALRSSDGFFPASLAARLGARLKTAVTPALALTGEAGAAGRGGPPRRVAVLGVPDSFFTLFGGEGPAPTLSPAERTAFVSEAVSRALDCRPGDEIVLRVERPGLLPAESVAGRTDERFFPLRLKTAGVLPAERGALFGLANDQAVPLNVFVPWELLARSAGLRGKANLLLAKDRAGARLSAEELALALKSEMRPADYGIEVREGTGERVEVRDDRLFVRPVVEAAARDMDPAARGRLVYFVNRLGGAPYSFAAAVDPADLPVPLKDDEIIVSDWLAADRKLRPGSEVSLAYFYVADDAALAEKEARFSVRAVLPQTHPVFDARLTPDFPGLTDEAECRSWQAGVPVDFSRIRPKDEAFWRRFRAAPKAVIGLAAGRRLWANRYGESTSLFLRSRGRWFDHAAALVKRLDPAGLGYSFVPLRAEAAAAAGSGLDFTGLFAGLGFFAVAAGLLLAAFLFSAAVADRRRELGLLRAAGLSRGLVFARLGLEGAVTALAGCAAGAALGAAFAGLMILLLKTLFSGTIGEGDIGFYFSWTHFAAGLALSFIFSLAVFALALIRETRRPIGGLLSGAPDGRRRMKKARRWRRLAAGILLIGFAFVLTLGFQKKGIDPGYFFAASAASLAGLLFLLDGALVRSRPARAGLPPGNAARALAALRLNRGRTVTGVLVLSLGVFLVAAVGANTYSLPADPSRRDTGTGGFALWVETAAPVADNLNDPAARARLGLDDLPAGVSFVPMRVRAGDDASCLNLNLARNPEVTGVDPAALASRKAFAFAASVFRFPGGASPWRALDNGPGGQVPAGQAAAIADEESLTWNLGLAAGDRIAIRDESGRERSALFVAALSNSLFQGSVIVSEDEFLRLYPSSSGYTRFLVDARGFSAADRDALAATLRDRLRPFGADVESAEARLFRYNRVADTYLLMFLVLGGLGLLIGIGGFGVLVRRDLVSRRGEIALMRAVGIPARDVFRSLLAEQFIVLAAALAVGLSASLVALLPAAIKAPGRLPWAILICLFAVMAVGGFLWVRRSVRGALGGDLIGVLKNE
ncbi:MAG: ABC transporter permease [Spirochaetales bacterium]|nr:ABC transporter permease [Spirochaetales bacterium]